MAEVSMLDAIVARVQVATHLQPHQPLGLLLVQCLQCLRDRLRRDVDAVRVEVDILQHRH
eukprot:12892637-Prorocentrum_lima.AAC.1